MMEPSEELINDSDNDDGADNPHQSAKDLFQDFTPGDTCPSSDVDSDERQLVRKKLKETPTKKYIQKYKKEWESKAEFKAWLSESIHGNTYFYCKFCKNDYRCGISDIHKHMSSKKHTQNMGAAANNHKFTYRGLLCPVFTPFLNSSVRNIPDVHSKAISAYSNHLKDNGIKAVLINDTLGEGTSLTLKERQIITERWLECCKRNHQFLMVQVGGAPFKDIAELMRHAERIKVGAVVVLPDLYNKPATHLDLIRYLKIIADFGKELPLIYHHNPQLTGVTFDVADFLVDITGEIDSFVGIIYTTNDMEQAFKAASVNKEKFLTFIGTDEAILPATASGFDCIMSASLNFAPVIVQKIYNLIRSKKVKEAQEWQTTLNKLLCAIYEHGERIPVLKAATDIVSSIPITNTRVPLQTLWEGTKKKLEGKLKEFNL